MSLAIYGHSEFFKDVAWTHKAIRESGLIIVEKIHQLYFPKDSTVHFLHQSSQTSIIFRRGLNASIQVILFRADELV
jgi:hypothetical protein